MKEILGDNLEKVMKVYNINATKTYQANQDNTDFRQVWELGDEDFEKLSNIPDDDWLTDYGWYRYSEGSNMGTINRRYNINNRYMQRTVYK